MSAPARSSLVSLSWLLLGIGVIAALAASLFAAGAAEHAARQAAPAFLLVTGLLLVGLVADADGVFEAAGSAITRLPGGTLALYGALMALVAVVTAVLNLDTAVVFCTPVVIHAVRRRGLTLTAPFLYGVVFMSNAASLLLPGSNLTNVIVLGGTTPNGLSFAARMLPAWVAAVLVTSVGTALLERRSFGRSGEGRRTPQAHVRSAVGELPPEHIARGVGIVGLIGVAGATVVLLVLPDAAIPILLLGIVITVVHVISGRVEWEEVRLGVDVPLLAGLFGIAVGLGAAARVWGSGALLDGSGPAATASIGSIGAVLVNNLPASMVLSAHVPAHARELLLGLDIGPNLAVTGSLSAILWLRVARRAGAEPSVRRYSAMGIVLAPVAILAALLAMRLAG